MTHQLEGIRLKLRRAQEHLITLDNEIGEYGNSDPHDFVLDNDAENARFILKLEPPPPRLSILIGDCVHNMRSALDHLIWQLILINGCTPKSKSCFPIFRTKESNQQRIDHAIKGVSKDAATLIEFLQPYHIGDKTVLHPLWLVHELSNIDKHRTLNAVSARSFTTTIRLLTGDKPGAMNPTSISGGVLYNGAELATFAISREEAIRQCMNVEAEGKLFVALDEAEEWRNEPATIFLERSLQFIANKVVPTFEPFFTKAT